MSQPFPGQDAPATGGVSAPGQLKFPFPAGHGIFPGTTEMVGGDTRFASTYAPSIEGLTNRTNYLANRLWDTVSGGDYSAWIGGLTIGNPIVFVGALTVSLGLEFGASSTLLMDAGSYLTQNGTANFNKTVNFASTCATTVNGPTTYGLGGAWRANRTVTIGATNAAFGAQTYDCVWLVSNLSDYTVTLTDPSTANTGGTPLPAGIQCQFRVPAGFVGLQSANAHNVTVKDVTGRTLGAVAAGSYGWFTIETVVVAGTVAWDLVARGT